MGNRILFGVPLFIGLVGFVWMAQLFSPWSKGVPPVVDNPNPWSRDLAAVIDNPRPSSQSLAPSTVTGNPESSTLRASNDLQTSSQTKAIVIGARELVRIIAPDQEMEIVVKIDTGADYSSIDKSLARSLGIIPHRTEKKSVKNAQGVAKREVVTFKYFLAGREITSFATLADRSNLSTPMIIGKEDLGGFLVDVSREFLTTPDTRPQA